MAQIFDNKDTEYKCPRCNNFLAMVDKRDTRVQKIACKKCNKWIWFTPCNNEYEIKKIPERNCSSGMRFY